MFFLLSLWSKTFWDLGERGKCKKKRRVKRRRGEESKNRRRREEEEAAAACVKVPELQSRLMLAKVLEHLRYIFMVEIRGFYTCSSSSHGCHRGRRRLHSISIAKND